MARSATFSFKYWVTDNDPSSKFTDPPENQLLRESYNQVTEEVEEQQADNNLILYIILAVVLLFAILIISVYLVRLNNRKLKFVHNLRTREEGESDL